MTVGAVQEGQNKLEEWPLLRFSHTFNGRAYSSLSSTDLVLLQQLARDDQPLQFIGAAADHQQRSIPVIAFHCEIR